MKKLLSKMHRLLSRCCLLIIFMLILCPAQMTKAANPEGCVDSVGGGMGTVTVRGWAFDRDSLGTHLKIHVYVGGMPGSGAPGYEIVANKYRPDVNNVYKGVGAYHGFEATIPVSVTGTKTIYIYAINVGSSHNPLIGKKQVTISKDTQAPTISNVSISKDPKGYTVNFKVTDNDAVSKVQCPTWTVWNEQDDLDNNWINSSFSRATGSNGNYSYRVNVSDHDNEYGDYITHIYAWDRAGNQAVVHTGTWMTKGKQIISTVSNMTKTLGDAGFYLGSRLIVGDSKLSFWSDNTKVATISSNGWVSIKGVGTAIILINAPETQNYNRAGDVVVITVKSRKKNQVISVSDKVKKVGDKNFYLGAKLSAGNGKLSYKSSNTKVATISSKGKVAIKGAGSTKITVKASGTSKYNAASRTITLTVKPKVSAKSQKKKALKAYSEMLSKTYLPRQGIAKDYRQAKKCLFAIAYIDNDSIPELVLYHKDSYHMAGWGTLYTYVNGKVKQVTPLCFDLKDTLGYYHKTGWYVDNYSIQGTGSYCYTNMHKKSGTGFSKSIKYLPAKQKWKETGYCVNNKSVSKKNFEKALKKAVGGKKMKKYKFYKNTSQNRKKYLK